MGHTKRAMPRQVSGLNFLTRMHLTDGALQTRSYKKKWIRRLIYDVCSLNTYSPQDCVSGLAYKVSLSRLWDEVESSAIEESHKRQVLFAPIVRSSRKTSR